MKKLLSIILFALLCCYAMAYDFSAVCGTGQTLYYTITSDVEPYTVEVTSETGSGYNTQPTGDLEIPETVEYNSITYSVTGIGNSAFYGCSGLTSVTIGNSVTNIGLYAFRECNGLETIILESGNPIYDSRDGCNAIIETATNILIVGCKNTEIPNSVTGIGEYAFYNCNGLTSVVIPNSVTSIDLYAFEGCSGLTEVTIPESVTSIGDGTFFECNGLTSISIPNSVTSIGIGVFSGCSGLTSVIIPNSVISIGEVAFANCSGLTSISIPNSVTSIGGDAFSGCTGLTMVTIGNSVENIGEQAFEICENLTEITIYANTPPTISDICFSETTYQTATLWVPIGTRDSYINADGWSQFFDIREVPYYWSCDFEGEEIWTVGNDQQNGNVQWQIVTPETYPSALISGDNAYIKPFVFQGDTLNDTPEHWAMADLISQSTDLGGPGQVAESSWIEFNNINLIEAEQPQITFRQIFRQLNGVETSIRVSIDGGQTWTDHIVNEEVEDNTYGEYEIRTGIREAAGEGNVTIRFLFNSDAHTTQMGYGWEIDDIEIKEAPDTIIASAGEGGTISPSGEVLVEIGESVTFTITPNDGYRIASVMVDETENVTDQLVDGVYTFENVTASHLIEATFEAIPSFTITVSVNNDAYGSVSGGGTYEEGSEVVITATPNQGYRFVSWSDGHVGNPRTIIVTSDSTFVANFGEHSNENIVFWHCDFEEETPLYTTGQISASDANWELQTKSDYTGENYFWAMNSTGENHPYGDISETPEHWMMIDGDGANQDGYDFDSYMEFSGIDLSDAAVPMICFYEYSRRFNMPPSMEATVIEVSIDGGATWTRHVVGCEEMTIEHILAYRRVLIPEAANNSNVTIRFRANRQESILQSQFGDNTSYSSAPFIVNWQVDDIIINETPACDLSIQDARISMFSYIDYKDENALMELNETRESAYHKYDPYAQTPRRQWSAGSGFTAFNVEVSSNGYDTVIPMVRIKITNPNGEEIYNKVASGIRPLSFTEGDTIDFASYDEESDSRIFLFEDNENIPIGRYIVDFYVFAEGMEDADTTNNHTTQYFDITENTFSMSYDEPTTYNYITHNSPEDKYGIKFTYDYNEFIQHAENGNVVFEAYIDEQTSVGTVIRGILYEYAGYGDINDINAYIESAVSESIEIDEDMLGTWINLGMNGSLNLSVYDTLPYTFIIAIKIEEGSLALGISYELTSKGNNSLLWEESTGSWNVYGSQLAIRVRELNEYTITVLSNNEAYGSVSGGGTYEEGTEITLTAIPYEGYRFYQWQDGNTENPRSITVTSDSTFVANFTPTTLPESINITDYNGNTYDIDALLDDGKYVVFAFFFTTCHYSQEEVPYVESIYTQMGCNTADVILIGLAVVNSDEPSTIEWFMDEFGATYPIASLEDNPINVTLFDDWGLDGTPTYILIQPNRSMIEMSRPPSADQLIAFGAHESPCLDTTYTITVLSSNDAYGSVSGGGTYNDGDIATIMAMPNGGYLFDSWEDDNAENPRTITVTSDSTFVADFVKCEITQAIDTVVPNFVTVGEHTFYSTGNYSFSVLSENDCDTIFDIRLRVLAEPVYDIGPNPTKSLLNINSDGFISAVEFYSVTGQLVMRKEVNGYEAEFDMEGLVDGVYILRIYGEESSLPSVSKVVKE